MATTNKTDLLASYWPLLLSLAGVGLAIASGKWWAISATVLLAVVCSVICYATARQKKQTRTLYGRSS